MQTNRKILFMILLALNSAFLRAQLPLVFDKENSGATIDRAVTTLPTFADCPLIHPLPDPFAWSADPLGVAPARSESPEDWEKHRQELIDMFQFYEIGTKPEVDPSQIEASFEGNLLTVIVTVGENRLTLTSTINFPDEGTNPYPIIIGMNSQHGSLPSGNFSDRGIATMNFAHDQVVTYAGWGGAYTNNDPFFKLYPEQNVDNTGEYAAWSWGVSRLIDGLFKLNGIVGSNSIDLTKIAVTGCSYAGKMALFAGALDERIALTIAQESGGGGATSWRYSATQSGVEGLAQTNYNWFKNSMRDFGSTNVSKIPTDHHLLNALIAPRALMVTGNSDMQWLSNKSCYVNSKATQQIYETLGISDRFAYAIEGGYNHCQFPSSQHEILNYMLDKFMKGNDNLSQAYGVFPSSYLNVNNQKWYNWWGTADPIFPVDADAVDLWLEAECAQVGSNWSIEEDESASNGKFIVSYEDNLDENQITDSKKVIFTFNIDKTKSYSLFGRVYCPSFDDDSYFVKIDDAPYTMINGLANNEWTWVTLGNTELSEGDHTLTIAYRENGAMLDKILLSTNPFSPENIGDTGCNCNVTVIPDLQKEKVVKVSPNPVTDFLSVKLEQSADKFCIYNSNGEMILILNGKKSDLLIDLSNWSAGIYFLAVNTSNDRIVKKIVKR